MKTQTIKTMAVMLGVITVLLTSSCKKEEIGKTTSNNPTNTTKASLTGKQTAKRVQFADKVLGMAMKLSFTPPSDFNFKTNDFCGTISVDTDAMTHTITRTYDFTSGCVGTDGITYYGSIVFVLDNGSWETAGNALHMTLNVTSDSLTATGNMLATNQGLNGSNHTYFSLASNLHVTNNVTGDTLGYGANYTYEWVMGEGSNPHKNLQFSITGGALATATGGATLTETITSPLLRNYDHKGCNYYVQGTYTQVYSDGTPTKTIDFGDGTCNGGVQTETQNGDVNVVPQDL